MVAAYAVFMSLAGLVFFYIGVSMGWLYTFMGVVLGSAVVPIALCVTWHKANEMGCVVGAVAGFFAGIAAWLATTAGLNNRVINVVTSGGDYEMLAGNLASIGTGGVIALVWSICDPADFNFDITRAINKPHHGDLARSFSTGIQSPRGSSEKQKNQEVTEAEAHVVEHETRSETPQYSDNNSHKDLDPVQLHNAFKFAAWSSIILLFIMIIAIPLPLFFAQTIYGVRGLEAWVVIGIIWVFCSFIAVVLYPLWESREALVMVGRGLLKDIFGGGAGKYTVCGLKKEKV